MLPILAAIVLAQVAPPADTERALVERAAAVTPSPRQLAWQRLEFEVFIHFGMNTFTDREWGEGNEDPKLFNPTDLDADQWARAAKDAGARAIVLVCKHHDGFCLWPSAFTEHSVKHSPWKSGRGDIVREVSDACKRQGLKFGVYLSPADLHEPTYGHSDEYNRYFINQLSELLTNYGPIHEVWFDGATPRDKGQVYDYQAWYALIRQLQPDAVIFGRGPDVRWVGNEAGRGRQSEWSVVALPVPENQFTWPDMTEADLGSIARLKSIAGGQYLHWYPAETDTSIRPGWFWHPAENARVRSLTDLLNVYDQSVGNNSVLLLNVPPDRRGRFCDEDVARLHELGAALRATFATNIAAGASVESTSDAPGHAGAAATDGNAETYWTTPDDAIEPTITLALPQPRRFNLISLREHIADGQRIEQFAVEVWDQMMWNTTGAGWKEVARGTTVGYGKLLRIAPEETDRVRIHILASRIRPTVEEVGLYMAPVALPPPRIERDRQGMVRIEAPKGAAGVVYTLDGSEPGNSATRYSKPFPLPEGGLVRARAIADGGPIPPEIGQREFDLCKAKWHVVSVSSDEADAGESAANAIDDDPRTIWHSRYSPSTAKPPHEIVIDLGEDVDLHGFTYLPRQNGQANGTVLRYQFFSSGDGTTWGDAAAAGEFSNIKSNPVEQRVQFPPRRARFIKFVALSEINGRDWGSAAEFGVITRP